MISLNLDRKPQPIRLAGAPNDIGDNLRVLACAQLLTGVMSLRSAKRCAKTLGLDIPEWSWDEAIAKFDANGRKVGR